MLYYNIWMQSYNFSCKSRQLIILNNVKKTVINSFLP